MQTNLLSATPRRHNVLLCEMLRDTGAGVIPASRVIEPRRDDGRDVTWHPSAFDREERWTAIDQCGVTVLLTELPASTNEQTDLLFVEVFVDTAVEECERRDPKGLHARARAGEIRGFTGVDAPYEPPEQPELRVDTSTTGVEQAVAQIIEILRPRSGSKRRGPR
jgi:Adenylylsulphate kinase